MPVTELSALTDREGHQFPDLQMLRRVDGPKTQCPLPLCKATPYKKKLAAPDRQTFALPLQVGHTDRVVFCEDSGQHHSSVR